MAPNPSLEPNKPAKANLALSPAKAAPAPLKPAIALGTAPAGATETSDKTPALAVSVKKTATILAAIAAVAIGGFFLFGAPDSDNLSAKDKQIRADHFYSEVAAGHLAFPAYDLNDPRQVDAAKATIAAMPADPKASPAQVKVFEEQKAKLVAQVQTEAAKPAGQRNTEFVVLRLYDNCAIDDDTVIVQAPGFPATTIHLTKDYKTVVIPKPAGAPVTVTVTGIHDGGGGETVGIDTASGPLAMPVFEEGQTIPLTIR